MARHVALLKESESRRGFSGRSGRLLRDISIGYQINKWEEETNSDTVRVTEWELLEGSVVTVPADRTVGINRSLPTTGHRPEVIMSDDTTPVAGTQSFFRAGC
ncbi:MAG: HK97 family phage prohead protease [Candidatus Competibacteraceae bacterium]|nr:HK97 family phage prohead protease [Candidatus Competibacteraceae bacterium]